MEAMLSDEDIQNHLLKLQKSLKGHDLLKKFEFDERYLLRFLLGANFQIPLALKRMQEFHLLLLNHDIWLSLEETADIIRSFNLIHLIGLPIRDRIGRRIILATLANFDGSASGQQITINLFRFWCEQLLCDDWALSKGLCILIDVKEFPWALFKWLTPSNIKMGITLLENYPVKEFMIHFVNKSYLVQAALKLIWPFLPRQMQEKMKFHFQNWSSLHEYVDPYYLPKEYAGSGANIDLKSCSEMLLREVDVVTEILQNNFVPISNT
ncbi:hypothetical protein RI129_004797 [Pyrocoelia pectoralis]|uniref:CRAL-TRIO domain-containing protein n=1 Tax=Pyrocoelia pectoralis TaxID=417401 RepID=A0AAN7VI87_9COLE